MGRACTAHISRRWATSKGLGWVVESVETAALFHTMRSHLFALSGAGNYLTPNYLSVLHSYSTTNPCVKQGDPCVRGSTSETVPTTGSEATLTVAADSSPNDIFFVGRTVEQLRADLPDELKATADDYERLVCYTNPFFSQETFQTPAAIGGPFQDIQFGSSAPSLSCCAGVDQVPCSLCTVNSAFIRGNTIGFADNSDSFFQNCPAACFQTIPSSQVGNLGTDIPLVPRAQLGVVLCPPGTVYVAEARMCQRLKKWAETTGQTIPPDTWIGAWGATVPNSAETSLFDVLDTCVGGAVVTDCLNDPNQYLVDERCCRCKKGEDGQYPILDSDGRIQCNECGALVHINADGNEGERPLVAVDDVGRWAVREDPVFLDGTPNRQIWDNAPMEFEDWCKCRVGYRRVTSPLGPVCRGRTGSLLCALTSL